MFRSVPPVWEALANAASPAVKRSTVVTDWSVGVPDRAGVVEVPDWRPLRPWMRSAR